MAQTEIYFLTVQETGKFKIEVQQVQLLSEGLLPGLQMAAFSLSPHTTGRQRGSPMSLPIRTLLPLDQGPHMTSFNLITLPQTLCLNIVTLEIGIDWREDTEFNP